LLLTSSIADASMGCGGSVAKKENAEGSGSTKSGEQGEKSGKGGFNTGNLVMERAGKISDFYSLDKKRLGEGSYGFVSKAKNKSTEAIRACKTIRKAALKNSDDLKREIAVMKQLDHPNICKLYESFEDHKHIYLIIELCTGGELFDRIIEVGHLSEAQCANLMQKMLRAIFYMHELHLTHRDLKPENFLFTNKDPIEKSTLKLIDFGLARSFKTGQMLTTKAGTPYYVAPQVLAGKYTEMADIWSLGVIMYVMLCGYPPFYGDTDQEVLEKVRAGVVVFQAADWKGISEDAKILIKNLLKMNDKDRYTAEQALNHEWIKNTAPTSENVSIRPGFVDKLRGFRSTNKLKKAALQAIANNLGDSQIQNLRQVFEALDENGDGLLTAAELRAGLEKSGLTEVPGDLQSILEGIDTDGSGVIDYTEFLAATIDRKSYMKEDALWAAFRVFDRDGNGSISKAELALVLGDENVTSMYAKDMAEIMKDVDTNGDGEIDFEEFKAMMKVNQE